MSTLQAERVKEAAKVKAAKEAKLAEKNNKVEKTETDDYNIDHLVTMVAALLAADKTRLLAYPETVVKAKQVLKQIYG